MTARHAETDLPVIVWHQTGRGGYWELHETWSHHVNGSLLVIDPPFSFDLASVPRIVWAVPGYAPMELGVAASLCHDYLYAYRGQVPRSALIPEYRTFKRREADRYFRELMAEGGIAGPRRTVAWLAVRLFGWWPWLKGKPAE